MKEIAIVESSKDFFIKVLYNIKYGRKFNKFNIDKSFSETLICRRKDSTEKEIFNLIKKSKNQEEFKNKINEYLKISDRNNYASVLLLGNMTGKYIFRDFYYESLKNINIDAFTKENQDILSDLRNHFYEYVINNNTQKNTFAERIKIGEYSLKDLSKDIDKDELIKDFDSILNGNEVEEQYYKPKKVTEYLIKIIGTYSKEDIKNNFDFILYDMGKKHTEDIEYRKNEYKKYSMLSNFQIDKIKKVDILKKRLNDIEGEESKKIILRLNEIEKDLIGNISELEDIYCDYEVLYREDLINNLYVPKEDITIIEDYKDLRPQLIHQFIRSTEKFRNTEIEKLKEKIISERANANDDKELTIKEQEKLEKLKNQMEANLNQYKVNYTTDGKGTRYTDSMGFDSYHSDTTNQISASVFEGKEFIYSSYEGIIGIGFNRETLCSEAIAISSNSYKTTNKGLNNLEYDEKNEFEEMSAPFSELVKSKGKSEIVIHRRGIDFDTKASYVLATIDSSDSKETERIMKQIKDIKEKEGLKVLIYDLNKIRNSYEQDMKKEDKEK